MNGIVVALLIIVIIAAMVAVLSGVKIIQPYEQAVYMRLGKYIRVLNQGLNFVCPLINQVVKLDLRTQVLDKRRNQQIMVRIHFITDIIGINITDPGAVAP